jgi:SAP domain
MKATQLKAWCKEHGLSVAGKRCDLQERLRAYFKSKTNGGPNDNLEEQDDFESMSVKDLRDALVVRNISSKGSKEELIERLRSDIKFANEVRAGCESDSQEILARILEEAALKEGSALSNYFAEKKAKSEKTSKFIDLTVTSLGLTPEKFTAGGAPSCTADVLRKLAGDPFADPPKYGTVRLENAKQIVCEAWPLLRYLLTNSAFSVGL